MRISSRNSQKKVNSMTPEQKATLDNEGKAIVEAFAKNMKQGVAVDSQENTDLLQQHFDWAKKSITSNKVEYLKIVRQYSENRNQAQAFDIIEPGLAKYIKAVALNSISKIR